MSNSLDRHSEQQNPKPFHNVSTTIKKVIFFIITVLTLLACQIPTVQENPPYDSSTLPQPTPEPILLAEVFFWVEIPENTPESEVLQLVILDEVTGLPFNQTRMDMISIDTTHYGIAVQATLGSIIKYRYERKQDNYYQEYTLDGEPIRYRIYLVEGPGENRDQVARWADTPPLKPAGRIVGSLIDKTNKEPIPNLLINVAGSWTFTTTDGSFNLPSIQEGIHNLTIYSIDGKYQTHQQVAQVASGAATTVFLEMEPSVYKDVTFVISVPENTIQGATIRFAGNLFDLGNAFTTLDGGLSGLTARMPKLNPVGDGRYSITLHLPTGIDIRYKYTLGNGFWNAEHDENFGFRIRQLVLPENDEPMLIEEEVATWQTDYSNPIFFDVTVPSYTPPEEEITIQFQLNGWMPPIPMWPLRENQWVYLLLGPLNIGDELGYRYCRGGQCGQTYDFGAEITENERSIRLNQNETTLVEDTVTGWHYLSGEQSPIVVPGNEIDPRNKNFTAGISLMREYHPDWGATLINTLKSISNTRANLVVFSPTWISDSSAPPTLFEFSFGKDYSYNELAFGIETAHQLGLRTAVYPSIRFPNGLDEWWQSVSPSEIWWQTFLEQYRRFILHHALLAEQNHADVLIIGGDWLNPALPGFHGYDQIYASQPGNINAIWSNIIQEIRTVYQGTIAWHLDFDQLSKPPHTVYEVDEIYLRMGTQIANKPDAKIHEIQIEVENVLDQYVKPFSDSVNKPIILHIAYPSADGGATYNLPQGSDTNSFPFESLSPLTLDNPEVTLDLQEQADVYNAILSAVNERPWISGIVSEGFFPPIRLEDKSISIHGKPAQEVLRYWFSHFRGD
jgi:hypothetical protein